jgi:proteasome lid subunit RPN8/RPN11
VNEVAIPARLLSRLETAARAAYPDEACGFLFSDAGTADAARREIRSVEPAANEVEGERRRRFVISPGELRAAEERGARRGEIVSGFYHSHPDHPARPSEFDTAHAWPWYAYIVVSVDRGGACRAGAFELDAERERFGALALDVTDPADGAEPAPRAAVPSG